MPKKTKIKIPKELDKVTSFSKILAAILFIALPLMFFYFGMNYGRAEASTPDCLVNQEISK